MGSLLVVDGHEDVDEGLELGDRGWLRGLGSEPVLQGLLEAFDFAAGGGVVRSGVLLVDAEADEFGFEHVAATTAAGEPGGVDEAVVGQGGSGNAVFSACVAERVEHDAAGDAQVRCDGQCCAGVVVEPGDDLDIDGCGEAVVGEVGLPGFVGLLCLETDVGRFRSLRWFGGDELVAGQSPRDRRDRDPDLVVMLEVPGDRVWPGVEALTGELDAHVDDQLDRRSCDRVG